MILTIRHDEALTLLIVVLLIPPAILFAAGVAAIIKILTKGR